MDLGDGNECSSSSSSSSSSMIIVGNYILGPRIGSGSFAVVWRSRHRHTGAVVAVKEINKKQLSPKVADNLLKEVSILSNIRHPNIIRLIEAIDTEDRIYLVLEYCEGGDLAAYIHRHGKVTEAVARHFMRQLAAGLQVLNENRLIHRDLKPQNLLLSTNEATPTLKIGDFGFARYLTPQGLADTLCGSPLYMAPEIIQNKKYDGKADLWSVGAILFQLVTGKPPFDGDSQLQLFQNILTSSELRFPQGTLQELNPDCVALCRALLRHNPVERLTFEELFNHKFLAEPRLTVEVEQSHQILQSKSLVEQFECLKLPLALDKRPQLSSGKKSNSSLHDNDDKIMLREAHASTSRTPCVRGVKQHTVCDRLRTSFEGELNSSDQLRVTDSMESIEKEYVLVNANFASVESFSCSLETSQLNNCGRGFSCPEKKDDWVVAAAKQENELASSSTGCTKIPGSNESDPLASSTVWRELQGLSILHPSTRLQLLNQYIFALSELAQVKFNAGLLLESFSVELVVLAIWKQAMKVCGSWLTCTTEADLPGRCSTTESTRAQEGASLPLKSKEAVDFNMPRSVCMWAEQCFLVAFDRAQKLSNHLQDMDGNAEMPDAMEIIFQTALEVGKSGAVDELIGNEGSAAASYSKAMILLSFIVGEATSLPLSTPFLLTPDDKKRIEGYIRNFESRQSHFKMSQACPKQMVDPFS